MLHCNANERKRISRRLFLSFDDGPSPNYTDTLLDLLAAHQIHASFFVVAESAEKNPHIMKKMRCAGHLIGLHSAAHVSAYLMTPAYAARDFQKSLTILHDLGISTRFYRPPWGHTTRYTRELAEKYRLQIVRWDVMAGDWKAFRSAGRIAACLRAQAAPDKIICLHDGRGRRHAPARTIEALRELLPLWIAEGWQFDTIDKLYLPQSAACRYAQQAQTADLPCGLSIQSERSEGCGR